MDRRGFCKTILVAPFIIPLTGGLNLKGRNVELQLISSSPHLFISPLLKEIRKFLLISGKNFSTTNHYPHKEELIKALTRNGWKNTRGLFQANIIFSFYRLLQPASPSFTLIKNGKVIDIRAEKLLSLWEEMNHRHPQSFWLTSAAFNREKVHVRRGNSATVYIEGKIADRFTLRKSYSRSYTTKRGIIEVRVENRTACVVDSCCANKICIHTPPVYIEGERIICAPSHFLLEVDSFNFVDTVIG